MTQPDSEIDREPDAEIQATANLSPVSPSPVHTAASQVVPALQDTADTIEAMVDAVAAPNGVDEPILDTVPDTNVDVEADAEDVVDDDSFNDAYEDEAAPNAEAQPAAPDTQDDNDDYAKTFDSPIEPDEANDADTETHVEVDTTQSGPNRETDQILDDTAKSEPSTDSAAIQTSAQGDHAAPTTHTGPSSAGTSKPASHQSPADVALESSNSQDASLDINQLVADLTSNSKGLPFTIDTTGSKSQHDLARAGTATSPSSALPSPSSLPPRPPIPHSGSHTLPSHHHPHSHTSPSHNSTDSINTLSTANAAVYNNSTSATSPAQYQAHSYPAQGSDPEYQRMWDQFMADERQYMSEAKWDRFPEGSRIFIGNLSSDKVSKRDVFDIFHRYGRLAQISLKSAYGFVQYHTVEEGQRAIDQLQDSEVKGRRIHLEISKLQDKSKKDRKQSPDRGRGRDGGRRGDKHGSRDDYRSARNQSPRRGNYQSRDDDYGRDRGFHSRARSRSPGYGRHDKGSYRRRSPSPYGRSRGEEESELPRRYGADVPDVQIITQPDVNRDFVAWVEKAFGGKGLKTDVMLLHPRFPKEKVIQRQAVEGGHAVVDLDLRAQNMAKIPCQVFDRSAGSNNVRFDQYVDLDPPTAAEIVVRTKSATAAANYSQPYGSGTSGVYTQHHLAPQPAAPAAYQQPPPSYPPQANNNAVAEIATLMSKMDSATLQQFLATIQGTPQAPAPPVAHNSIPAAPVPAGNQQVDLQAILGALGGNAAQAPQPAYGAPYGGQPGANGAAPAGDQASAAQVQSIMAQLARFRQ